MIAIIGNGISGITAARHIRKNSDEEIVVISSESKYFFSRTALMYVYMGHMTFEHTQPYEPHFWEENKIDLIHDYVNKVDTERKVLEFKGGGQLSYSKLIIATGSKPNKFGWKGQYAKRVSGLYSKQDLEYIEQCSEGLKTAVVIGGGLIGIELVEMFLSRNIEVHFIIREERFWDGVLPKADAEFVMKHISHHKGLTCHYSTELDEILTNEQDEAIGIRTKNGDQIECQFVGLTPGVSPNVEFLKSSGIKIDRGIVIDRSFRTSAPDVYAIGDCAQFENPLPQRAAIEQVWYTGKFMGELVAQVIHGESVEYNPGHWFNSAKFFDLEYQTYGIVENRLIDSRDEFIYQDSKGEVLLHFVFETESRKFIGVNAFGIRLRHPVFNEWLLRGSTIEEVISQLPSANFDPEFYRKYEEDILSEFNKAQRSSLSLKKGKWWQQLITH